MKQAHFKGTADTTHTKSVIMSATLDSLEFVALLLHVCGRGPVYRGG